MLQPSMMRAAPKARPKTVAEPIGETETETMRILVVEDNPKMALAVKQALQEQGYGVDIAETGSDGEQLAIIESYDIIVLDVMLPDRDGVEVCRRLRKRGMRTPVLMLTALSTTTDKVAGLDAGADDYLPKPFEFEELLARIRALLRRGEATESSVLRYDDIEMDLLRRKV
ncbi:MAG: response regulator transcription factor, partial [Planctomycetota bacterium]|nr:response regulator transcription factor [Planctomycetota bacterium]